MSIYFTGGFPFVGPNHGTQLLQNLLATYMHSTMQQQKGAPAMFVPPVPLPVRSEQVKNESEVRDKRKASSSELTHGIMICYIHSDCLLINFYIIIIIITN